MRNTANWASAATAHALRIVRWSSAHLLVRLEEYAFDYVVYPFMLYRGGDLLLSVLAPLGHVSGGSSSAGYWVGFGILVAASMVINLAYVRAYDRLRTDWFGFEALKSAVDRIPPALRWGPWSRLTRYATFAYLSTWHSPLFATLFMRRAPNAYAMTPMDWRTFWASIAVSNLGWAGLVTGVVEGGKRLFEIFG